MDFRSLSRLRDALVGYFPERHLYVRSGGEIRSYVLSTTRQLQIAGAIAAAGVWLGVSTAAVVGQALSDSRLEQAVSMERAKYERRIADREARLNSAVAQLSDTNGVAEQLASAVEKRQAALATLLQAAGLVDQAEGLAASMTAGPGLDRIQMMAANTDRLLDQAETKARTKAERLRLALRLAGLNPSAYAGSAAALGGPLIEAGDTQALAVVLDVPEEFARRIQRAAGDLSQAEAMMEAAAALPLAQPTVGLRRSSGFGARLDPFTRRPAIHEGLDYSGPMRAPIVATGPGVVSYVGPRSGYGTVVEIDHGKGYKTRYAHLSSTSVRIGERVTVGQRIGALGNTGRSTGPHLHYEVWVNGRAQNPDRFLKAGNYVQQAN